MELTEELGTRAERDDPMNKETPRRLRGALTLALFGVFVSALAVTSSADAHIASSYRGSSHMGCSYAGQSAMGYDTYHQAYSWTASAYGCAGYLELWVQMPRESTVHNHYNNWVAAAPSYYYDYPAYPYYEPYSDIWAVFGHHRISVTGPDASPELNTIVNHPH